MNKYFKYLSYLIKHKYYVFLAGLDTGAPIWRLVIHDWSKFLPSEWFHYMEYFYGKSPQSFTSALINFFFLSPYTTAFVNRDFVASEFNYAWLHHQHKNPHHWQYWVLREDSGETIALTIPDHFIREMVADWAGAGKAITGKWEVREWYEKNKDKMILSDLTRWSIEKYIDLI